MEPPRNHPAKSPPRGGSSSSPLKGAGTTPEATGSRKPEPPRRRILSTSAIARAIRRPHGFGEQLMAECERLGHVERVGDDGWRLTEQAEARHDRHLRGLEAA